MCFKIRFKFKIIVIDCGSSSSNFYRHGKLTFSLETRLHGPQAMTSVNRNLFSVRIISFCFYLFIYLFICLFVFRPVQMMSNKTNSSVFTKGMDTNLSVSASPQKLYIFTPAGLHIKLTLALLMVAAGTVGFLGNLSVLRFIRKGERKRARLTTMPSNLNYFIRSLAISDVLGVLICTPLLFIQYFIDVFQTGWPCRISRFFIFLFPVITSFNLVVIALERYILICRPTSRPLSRATVQEAVKGAWLLGLFVTFFPASTLRGIRVELNDTHYTMICKFDISSGLKVVIVSTSVFIIYILPFVFILFACVSVIRKVLKRKTHAVVITEKGVSSAMRKWRSKQRKATLLLLVIIFAFVVPYLLIMAYTVHEIIVKPPTDFKRDFVLRATGAFLAYLNSAVNFCIHLLQLPGFRLTFKCFQKAPNLVAQKVNRHEMQINRGHPSTHSNEDKKCKEEKIRRASTTNVQKINIDHLTCARRHSV